MIRTLFLAAAVAGMLPPAPGVAQVAPGSVDVLVRPVVRGEILSAADFTGGTVSTPLARMALRAQDASGMAVTRNMIAGSTVRATDLSPPALVRRGEAVSLVLRSGALVISAPGRSLSDGGAGAAVRVVNLATNRTIDGQVEAPGRVLISAP